MAKHRRTRRSQKGGGMFDWFGSSDPNAPPKKSWSDWWSGTSNTANNFLGNTANDLTQSVGNIGSSIGLTSSNPAPQPISEVQAEVQPQVIEENPQQNQVPIGGRRRRRGRTMKGGKGGLGLTYYASPVSGLKVAQPTTWQHYANGTNQYSTKGGSRRRKGRKSRKIRRLRKH